jgi:hypothetical protein
MIYAQRKMPQYFYENSAPEMPHWCVALIPDDEQTTVTFLPGSQRLTLEQAEKKAEELK